MTDLTSDDARHRTAGLLRELPWLSHHRSGWPWTEETPPPPSTMDSGEAWPRISIVTPSFNQAAFLEATIRSVLLQNYPNLDFIVIDGGSTDGSTEIIGAYSRYLSYHVSEKDDGQSHAINKGLARATGEIVAWLNSDDLYCPGALATVAQVLSRASGNYALAGHCVMLDATGQAVSVMRGRYAGYERLVSFWKGYEMHQPAIFWRREVVDRIGLLDESQHYIMDFDYWARIAVIYDFVNLDRVLACAHYHKDAKTSDGFARYYDELRANAPRYWGSAWGWLYWKLKASMFYHLSLAPGLQRMRSRIARQVKGA